MEVAELLADVSDFDAHDFVLSMLRCDPRYMKPAQPNARNPAEPALPGRWGCPRKGVSEPHEVGEAGGEFHLAGVGRSGGSSAIAFISRSWRHSMTDLITSVTSARMASSEATANAATDWYSL